MDELVKLVASRTGIPEDKARMAVELVMQHLKGKLPRPPRGAARLCTLRRGRRIGRDAREARLEPLG